jgi:hypothetical protein
MCGLMHSLNPPVSYRRLGDFFLVAKENEFVIKRNKLQDRSVRSNDVTGMRKRKGVRFPCCRATVMETKADHATALTRREGGRVGCPEPGDVSFNTTAWKEYT